MERPGIAIASEGKSFCVNWRKETAAIRAEGRMLGTVSRGRREADTAAAISTVEEFEIASVFDVTRSATIGRYSGEGN